MRKNGFFQVEFSKKICVNLVERALVSESKESVLKCVSILSSYSVNSFKPQSSLG